MTEKQFVMLLNKIFAEITENLLSRELISFFYSLEITQFNLKNNLTESITLTVFSEFVQRNPVNRIFNERNKD